MLIIRILQLFLSFSLSSQFYSYEHALIESTVTITTVSGIKNNNREAITYHDYFNLAGQRLETPQKGINIQHGRKVVVK